MADQPTTEQAAARSAEVSVERAQQFLDLWLRLVGPEAFEVPPAIPTPGRVDRSGKGQAAPESEPEHAVATIDLSGFIQAVVRERALTELAAIVLDLPDDTDHRPSVREVRDGLPFFATECFSLISEWLGFGNAMASTG